MKIKAGRIYRRRDGKLTGPLEPWVQNPAETFTDDEELKVFKSLFGEDLVDPESGLSYSIEDGGKIVSFWMTGEAFPADLVEEVE